MTKRSKITLFGLLALIAAFGLILTGCPDAAGSGGTPDPETIYSTVQMAKGTHGHAADGKIIGLEEGAAYVVRTGGKWYGVDEDGKLLDAKTTPTDAIATDGYAALGASANGEITGLSNKETYSVYLDASATAAATSEDIGRSGDVDTEGLNAIVSIDGLANGNVVNIVSANRFGGSLVVLIDQDDNGAKEDVAAGTLNEHTRIKGKTAANGFTYSFSGLAGSAKLEKVTAGDLYFELSNISSDFLATITATTASPGLPVKAALSQATSAISDGAFTVATGSYVVLHRGNWYAVVGDTATARTLELADNPAAAVTATAASGTTGITELINDEVYDVYLVLVVTGSSATIGSSNTNAKNVVVKATHATPTLTLSDGAFVVGSTMLFITDSPIVAATSDIAGGSGGTPTVNQKIKTDKNWTFTTVTGINAAKVYYANGAGHFRVLSNHANTAFIITVTS